MGSPLERPARRRAPARAGTATLRPATSTWAVPSAPTTAHDGRGSAGQPDQLDRAVARCRPSATRRMRGRRPCASPRPTGRRRAGPSRPAPRRPVGRRRRGGRPGRGRHVVALAPSSGGQIRSRVSIRAAPSRDDGLADEPAQEAQVGRQPEDHRLVEGRRQARERRPPGPGRRRRSWRASGRTGRRPSVPSSIPASTRTRPSAVSGQRSASIVPVAGQEPGIGVLGVQPDLDGVSASAQRGVDCGLVDRERLAGGDRELVGDEIATGHELGHGCSTWSRVFISRKKNEPPIVEQELARPGARRSRPTPARASAARRARRAERAVDGRRWRLLEDLLVTSLERAVALAEVDALAVGIEQDLDLHVARPLEVALEDEPIVAERGRAPPAAPRPSHRRADRGRGRSRIPLPPPPAAGLTISGSPIGRRPPRRARVRLVGPVVAGDHRHAELASPADGPTPCRPWPGSRPAGGPTQRDPGRRDPLGEVGALARNPTPGWTASAPAPERGADDRPRVQQVERRLPVSAAGRPRGAEPLARPPDAVDDLAAVGDEHRSGSGGARRPGRRTGSRSLSARSNASNASNATRQRPPTRRAGAVRSRSSAARSGSTCRDGRGLARAQLRDRSWRDCRVRRSAASAAAVSPSGRA